MARHARSEEEEKKRFLKAMHVLSNRRSRKSETKGENTDISQDSKPHFKIIFLHLNILENDFVCIFSSLATA